MIVVFFKKAYEKGIILSSVSAVVHVGLIGFYLTQQF